MVQGVTLEQLRRDYRPQILALAAKHGVEDIRVFGSVARGDASEKSDVDFLIRMKSGYGLWEMGGLQWRLAELLQTEVQLVNEKSVAEFALPQEREHIFGEAVSL
jgi:predicted nucleotidyltransferase